MTMGCPPLTSFRREATRSGPPWRMSAMLTEATAEAGMRPPVFSATQALRSELA